MTKFSTLAGAGAILMMTGAGALAAPCATGTTTNASGKKDTSSNVDGGSTAKVTPGAKAESPGTVGALNNAAPGGKMAPDEKAPPEGKTIQGQNSNDC